MHRNFGLKSNVIDLPAVRRDHPTGQLGGHVRPSFLSRDQYEVVMACFLCIFATFVGSFFGIAWFVASMVLDQGSIP